ncbi:hypothetical protein KI387_007395, partial [Taxus chinensis]
LLRGLQYLHVAHILHRDLKPQNILVSEAQSCNAEKFGNFIPRIKLCDFGISRKIAPNMTGFVATAAYRPPEHFFGYNIHDKYFEYGSATDVWAVGCILAELLLVNILGSKAVLFENVKDSAAETAGFCKNLEEYAKIIQIPHDADERAELMGSRYVAHMETSKTFPHRPTNSVRELLERNVTD